MSKLQNETGKLGVLTRLAYGSGEVGSQLVWCMCSSYLSLYYTEVLGFAPAVASLLFLVARIWDACNDPMMGMIAERTHSKLGRFRPYIIYGSPILALFATLTFTTFGSGGVQILWAYVTYILCGMSYTLVTVPYQAMNSAMTFNAHERNLLNTFRMVGLNGGMILLNIITMPIVMALGGTATGKGYTMAAMIFGIASIPLFVFMGVRCKENVKPVERPDAVREPISHTIKEVFQNRHLIMVVLYFAALMCGVMGRIGLVSYYAIYNMGNPNLIAPLMVVPTACSVISLIIGARVLRNVEKRTSVLVATIISAIALAALFFTPADNVPLTLIFTAVYGFSLFASPFATSMCADAVDWGEWKYGNRIDGTAYACMGLANKFGAAVPAAVGLALMGMFGFVANTAQSAASLACINFVANGMPAIFFFLGFVCMLFYKLPDKQCEEIRAELIRRRGE